MTLKDDNGNNYDAQCKIGEKNENINEDDIWFISENEEENQNDDDIDFDIDTKEEEKENTVDDDIYIDIKESDEKEKDDDIIIDASEEENDNLALISEEEEEEEKLKNNLRNLEDVYTYGVCYFDPPKESNNLYYLENSLVVPKDTRDQVEVKEDFYVIAQKCLSKDDSERVLNIKLSFRQLSRFQQVGDTITFWFFILTTEKLSKGYTIEFYIYLLLLTGEREEQPLKVICELQEDVDPKGTIAQADFKCTIEGLTKQYSSLVFSHSYFISGIPDDETLLNPVLTDQAIKEGKLLDYSLPENKEKVPAYLTIKKINGDSCSEEGTFSISGTISGEIKKRVKVKLPISYPKGVKATCTIPKTKENSDISINCILGGEINMENLIFEQKTFMKNGEEILTIGAYKSEDQITCIDGEKIIAEKSLNATLFFRQLRAFQQLDLEITFKFYALTSSELKKGYEISMWVFLILLDGTKELEETEAICVNLFDVSPTKPKQEHVEFTCTIDLIDPSIKYKSFELSYSDYFALPTDKTLLDPLKTEEAIARGELVDYSDPENQKSIPVQFDPTSITETSCDTDGKFSIRGTIDDSFENDNEFTLKISNPEDYEAKCKLAKSSGSEIQLDCVIGGKVTNETLMIGRQIVTSAGKEILIFGSIKSEPLNCLNHPVSPSSNSTEPSGSSIIIKLSFRQLRKFIQNGSVITFDFYALTSVDLEKGYEIIIWVFLLLPNGSRESKERKATCALQNDVKVKKGEQAQADFVCEISDVDASIEYLSFELSRSDYFILPRDKILLDPVKTEEAIARGELIDYSLPENKSKVPILFEPISITETTCNSDGRFKINGNTNGMLENNFKFTLEATYPKNYQAKCSISGATNTQAELDCIINDKLVNEYLDFPSQLIRNGLNEVFTFDGFKSSPLNCLAESNSTSGDEASDKDHPIIPPPEEGNNTYEESSSNKHDEKDIFPSSDRLPPSSDRLPPSSDRLSPSSDRPPSSDKPREIDIDINTDEEHNKVIDVDANSTDLSEAASLQNALIRANISLSFRQINKFTYEGGILTVFFFGLTTINLEAQYTITIFVNLIDMEGEREEDVRELSCVIEKEASPNEGETIQADFKCTIDGLTGDFYSLRVNSSDYVNDIPKDDETLLDPKLTAEAIERGELLDYSLEENKGQDKIPSVFSVENVAPSTCLSNGQLIIEGSLSKTVSADFKFKVPLEYPTGTELTCSLSKKEKGSSQITCKVDRDFSDNQIVAEQKIIKDGLVEVLILKSVVSTSNISCANGLLLEASDKANVKISFRQVSHFKENGINGFSFFLASLISQALSAGHSISIKIYILINRVKTEKSAKCTLQSSVSPSSGSQVQGDFICESEQLKEEEYKQINFTDTQSVGVSSENSEISGVSDLDDGQSSPIETDKEIADTLAIKSATNGNITELADVVDYYEEENKNLTPPTLEITSFEKLNECGKKGKFRILGKFSEDITKEITFKLPLSFPHAKIKCKVDEATKDEEVELNCKVQRGFMKVKSLVIEQRTVKNKNKEVLFIKSKIFTINSGSMSCINYNQLKYERAKRRQKSNMSFLQVSNFNPVNNLIRFAMAIMFRQTLSVTVIRITIKVTISVSRRNVLRNLAPVEESLPVSCSVSGSSSSAANLDCQSDSAASGTPGGMTIDNDENTEIAGVPEDADPSKTKDPVDYSNANNLKLIDDLPTVTISSVNGSYCPSNGSYTIYGTYDKGTLKDTSNITIPFSTVDSSGLCEMIVGNNKNVRFNCENKEQFSVVPIAFETMIIEDSNGKALFKLNNYTNLQQFACSISVISDTTLSKVPFNNNKGVDEITTQPTTQTTTKPTELENNGTSLTNLFRKGGDSGGLSGGAIAAIIVCAIIVIAVIGVLIGLAKSGAIFSSKSNKHSLENSTLNKISLDANPNEI